MNMLSSPRFAAALAVIPVLFLAGCPHRSPQWSPDGKHLLVLAGRQGEAVETAASQLWLVDLAGGTKTRLAPPESGARFLAAVWLDARDFLVATGKWDGESVLEGSGKLWRRGVETGAWTRISGPAPSGERTTRRLPVPIGSGRSRAVVYATGGEKVVALSLESGKILRDLEPAELVGPGPRGGFLIYRDDDEGVSELVAIDGDLHEIWKTRFSALRASIARKLRTKAVEIVFSEPSTSHLPLAGSGPDWTGVTLVYVGPGWEDGIPGFYARLAAQDGSLLDVAQAKGLWGQPASAGGLAWCVTAPDPKGKIPAMLRAFDLEKGSAVAAASLEALRTDQVRGYSVGPGGKRLALSVSGESPEIHVYSIGDRADLGKPTKIALE